jgi:RND family efflux transporter MFP subunit
MRYEIAIGLLSLLPLLAACSRPAPAATELPVPKVTVSAVVSQETIDADEYTGQTEASEIVEIRARVFGYLKSIDFKDGDYVQEGQTLFTIEPDEYDAIHQQSVSRIELNQASLALAKAKHARNEKLVRTGAVTPEEFEESQTAVVEAEAKITAAKADANRTAIDLKYTVLKAPISGRIDRALVSKGNLLTGGTGSGTLLTKIVKEQPMYVYFDVDERSLLRYMRQRGESRDTAPGSLREEGVPCYLQLADEVSFVHEGKLDFAATEVSTSTGTARIRAVFPNEDRALASGLFVRVKIPVSKPYEALLVPERALAADQNIKFVYVVGSDGTATRRNVELGGQRGEMRIVTKGLQAGDRVIVKGLQRVKPGQKVEAELAQVDATPTTLRKPVTPAAPTRTRPAAVPQPTQQRSASHER